MDRALVIMPHNPGDVVMALHVVSALNYHYPRAKIDFLVSDECACLVENNPYIHTCHIIPRKSIKSELNSENMENMISLAATMISRVKENVYDLSLNLFQDKYGALIHSFIRSAIKLGYHFSPKHGFQIFGKYMRHFFSIPVNRSQNPWHVVDIFLKSFDLDYLQRFKPEYGELPNVDSLIPPHFPKAMYAFQLGAAWEGKKWPINNWAELSQSFLEKGYGLVFMGAAEEYELFKQLQTKISHVKHFGNHCLNLIGKTDLLETRSIYKKIQGLVTPDTVAMHLAADLPCKVFAMFASSNPVETGPYGPNNFIFQRDVEVPEALPWEIPNKAMAEISAEELEKFILEGIYPKKTLVWTSFWDIKNKCQRLVDFNLNPHPFQKPSVGQNLPVGIIPPSSLTAEIKSQCQVVLAQLQKSIKSSTEENLNKLILLDKKLEEITRRDIFWEAYRIKCNSIPIQPIPTYLKGRLRLLEDIVDAKI